MPSALYTLRAMVVDGVISLLSDDLLVLPGFSVCLYFVLHGVFTTSAPKSKKEIKFPKSQWATVFPKVMEDS